MWLLVAASWKMFPVKPATAESLAEYTPLFRPMFRPDYDMPIYFAGCLFAILGGALVVSSWRRKLAGTADVDKRNVRSVMDAHLFLAVLCLGSNVLLSNPVVGAVIDLIALLIMALLFFNACSFAAVARRVLPGSVKASKSRTTLPPTVDGGSQLRPHWFRRISDFVAVGIILSLVYVPDVHRLAVDGWRSEGFYHWSFYAMGPALAYRCGGALGTEFYTQYGVGWPLTAAIAAGSSPLTYELLLRIAVLFGAAYFVVLYFFLKAVVNDAGWALFGVCLAVWLHLFCGNGMPAPIWIYPSSTILRNPFDVAVFWSCFNCARFNNVRYGWLIGGLGGLSQLFATDTGIYLNATICFFIILLSRRGPAFRPISYVAVVGRVLIGFAAVAGSGLALASRGTLWTSRFWGGYFESLIMYGDGFSALPMQYGIGTASSFLLTIVVLVVYSLAIIVALVAFRSKEQTPTTMVVGQVAATGLALMLVFINRSHPWNIYHVLTPFCIILAITLPGCLRQSGAVSSFPALRSYLSSPLVAPAATVIVLAAIAYSPNSPQYHSLFGRLCGNNESFDSTNYGLGPSGAAWPTGLADTVQRMTRSGIRSVAVVDESGKETDTVLLSLADLRPYFRYSPVIIVKNFQFDRIRQEFEASPPDVVIFVSTIRGDTRAFWASLVQQDYERELDDGSYVIYRRRGRASGS
jgi:hypothetical protein